MNPEKLHRLLRNIRNLKYPTSVMRDIDRFEKVLAEDLDTDVSEAMAILGYLLARDYVRIISDMGLVVNPESKELQKLVVSGALDRDI